MAILKCTTLIILVLTFFRAFGQTFSSHGNSVPKDAPVGYIVNWEGDTTRCEFKGTEFPKLKYKPINSSAGFQSINIARVQGWYSTIDSATYQAKYLDSLSSIQRYFRVLESGAINLYERYDINHGISGISSGSAHLSGGYYVSSCNDAIRPIPSNDEEAKGFFYRLFTDDKDLSEKLKNETSLSMASLTVFIRKYNIFKSKTPCLILPHPSKKITWPAHDYVILKNGDTLQCIITVPSLFSDYKYRRSEKDLAIKIQPKTIKEYCLADKKLIERAVYKKHSDKPVFMYVFENGKISLYEETTVTSTGTTTTTNIEWYVSKGTDSVTLLKSHTAILLGAETKLKRQDELSEMLRDNKGVYDTYMTQTKLYIRQIASLIHLYNTGELLR